MFTRILIVYLLMCPLLVTAQKQTDTWHFGRGCSMYFKDGSLVTTTANPAIQPHQFSQYIYSVATICNRYTGDLLFYTNGGDVMDKNHQSMPNGKLSGPGQRIVIVPDVSDSMQYFIFYMISTSVMHYAKVDMRLNNGLGDVVYKNKGLGLDIDYRYVVVQQLYGQGSWLIAHSWTNNVFYAYRITGDMIEAPVISVTGPERVADPSDFYRGDMAASTDGNLLAYSFKTVSDEEVIGIYDFDKKCGKLSFNQQLRSGMPNRSLAFDHTSQFLYVSGFVNQNFELLQYDLFSGDPDQSKVVVGVLGGSSPILVLRLAPDNRIYITSEEAGSGPGAGLSPSSRLHVVEQPWIKGTGCGFKAAAIPLDPGTICQGILRCRITSVLPDAVSDRTLIQAPGYGKPLTDVKLFCLGDQTTFAVNGALIADSVRWVFGDGDSLPAKNVTHAYGATGKYTARFKWYVCGFEYAQAVTVKIGERPPVSFGDDTTLCAGTRMQLAGPPGADEYLWSTGDSTDRITVTMPGTYALTVKNGGCSNRDGIDIAYYPSLWTALGDEYFICNDDRELTRLDAGEGFVNYRWTPTGDTLQWIDVADLGEYFVVVRDFRGCTGNDGTTVKRRCPVRVFFPNAFTPNGDGLNDLFDPAGKDVTMFHMMIYNRWGEAVFETHSIDRKWDGTCRDKPSPDGVYIYKADYKGYRNKQLMDFSASGNLTLIR